MLLVREVSKWYEGSTHPAIYRLSFSVGRGEVVGLLGTNGAGKTTTLTMVAGLLSPSLGDIVVNGMNVRDHNREVHRILGYLPENPRLYERLTGLELLTLICSLRGISPDVAERRIDRFTRYLGLDGRIHSFISTYSKGMIQKLAFIAAVLHNPALLLLDEPTAGLDPIYSRKIKEWIRGYSSRGNTVVLSTHITDLAEKVCDRVVIIHRGVKLIEGSISQILQITGTDNLEDAFIKVVRELDVVHYPSQV